MGTNVKTLEIPWWLQLSKRQMLTFFGGYTQREFRQRDEYIQAEGVINLESMFGVGAREVPAYGCIHCQHLQIAVSFIGDDLQRYQQFEDEQPVC